MKNSRKYFILIETVLAVIVLALAFILIREKSGKSYKKVSVIVQNSDDNQWSAFKYGLKLAAQDREIEYFVVSTGDISTVEEEIEIIKDEIENGADAVIVQPVPGTDTEKLLKKINVPVMLVEYTASMDRNDSIIPVTAPDHYAMGITLAEEILKDYNGNIEGKTFGIIAQTADSEASANRKKGIEDILNGRGAEISWFISGSFGEGREITLKEQPWVDIVISLDDNSLTAAGECSANNDLHGAVIYGIGNSTEAIYYLDTGIAECLIVPDEFNAGYQSLTETAESLENLLHTMESKTVSYTVIRRKELFSPQNQEIIFTMSQ